MRYSIAILFFLIPFSDIYPQATAPFIGQDYQLVYNPLQTGKFKDTKQLYAMYTFNFWGRRTGTRLALRANILSPDTLRAKQIVMKKDGQVWKATISIPLNAAVLSYYVTDGSSKDLNDDKTFAQLVYISDGKPAQNAHFFMIPFLKLAGASLEEMIEEARKEILLYPENFRAYYQYYQLRLDWKHGAASMQSQIAEELAALEKTYAENVDYLNLAARTYYYLFRNTKVGLQYRNRIPSEKQYPDVGIMYDRDAVNEQREKITRQTSVVRDALINKPAPAFKLHFHAGGAIDLQDLKGTVVLINFWATWCKPCKEEMPHLQKIFDSFKTKGFDILAINMDQNKDVIQPFLDKYSFSFPVLINDGKVITDYGVGAIPQSVIIDKNGIVKKIIVGYAPGNEKEIQTLIESLLQGS